MSLSISTIQTAAQVFPTTDTGSRKDLDNAATELIQFPEGGSAAWRTVIGGALVQFCGYGYISSFGVYQDFYTLQYLSNESPSAIAWIGSVEAFLASSFGLISGSLYDRGYFYHLLIGGTLLHSFSLFMLSLTKPGQYYQIFLAQGIGLGIAHGLVLVPSLAVTSQYFHKRRTLAMSLVVAGSSVGSIVHPIILNNLFNCGVGFVNGVRISAAFVSVLLFTACLLIRTRLEPPKNPVNYLSIGKGVLRDVPFCIMSVGIVLVLLCRLTTGFIAPPVSVPIFITISTAVCSILIFGMIGLYGVPTFAVLGTIYGYFYGDFIALVSPLVAHLTSDISELGARIGIAITVLSIGSLIDGPISGALLTPQFKWWHAALFNGLIGLTGSSLLLLMQLALRRKRSTD